MYRKLFLPISMIAVCVFMLAGCLGGPRITKLVDVNTYEKPLQQPFEKIMVVGKPIKEENRKDFEVYFSDKLKNRKTKTAPSYELIPDMDSLSPDSIKEAAVKMSADVVLATRVVGVDEKEVVAPRQMRVHSSGTPAMGGMGMAPFIEQPYVKSFTNVRLETGLFDVETEKMVWSASSVIIAPESVNEAIKDFSKAIISQLKEDGFIN